MRKFLALSLIALGGLVYMTSCTKSNNTTTTIRDTTVVKDTIVIKDTISLRDTIIEKDPLNPIVGVWAGVYFVNGDAVDSSAYTFYIRSDHQMIAAAGGGYTYVTYSSGPWTLSGKNFTATMNTLYGEPANAQAITATYDSTKGTLIGTWNDISGTNHSSGTLNLVRVP